MLAVDDNSPDGTGELADRLAEESRRVRVLHREREGLGPAYIAAFRAAVEEGAELVLTMDCDFSHDPADVPRLVAAADGADVVIGSRYVGGGGVRNWGLVRRVVSRGGCLYAQVLLGAGIRDLTGGLGATGARCSSASASTASPRRATPSRSRRPTEPSAPASASSRSPSSSPTGRRAARR